MPHTCLLLCTSWTLKMLWNCKPQVNSLHISCYYSNRHVVKADHMRHKSQAFVTLTWVLKTEFWSFGRTASALHFWVISPAPLYLFIKIFYVYVWMSVYGMCTMYMPYLVLEEARGQVSRQLCSTTQVIGTECRSSGRAARASFDPALFFLFFF